MHSKDIDPTISASSSSASTGAETTTTHPREPSTSLSHQISYITEEERKVNLQWHPADKRPLYFAYGSNLSVTQMRMRCVHDPDTSSKPLAIARLDGWRWLICQAGYANVIPPREMRVGRQKVIDCEHCGGFGGKVHDSEAEGSGEDVVYGILYEMTPADEYVLDGYEGVDHSAPTASPASTSVSEDGGTGTATVVNQKIRPREQGNGDYNKWYVGARVIEWLDEEQRMLRMRGESRDGDDLHQVLVYVDEERVRVGPPKEEYIPRMNRAIREAQKLGFPKKWTQDVMWKHIPEL